MRLEAEFRLKVAGRFPDAIKNSENRTASFQGRVLEGPGRSENGHDAVSSETLYNAVLISDRCPHQVGQALHQGERSLFSGLFGKGGESYDVGEQYGDLPTFWLHERAPPSNQST
ncbi:MAG TPA: hypothetical protein VMS87_09640 [Roseiarcus sp.]|nr:hypothetical protein [Roseiarcus sp.]